jgi:hypothetical protein
MKTIKYFMLIILILQLTSCEPISDSYGDGGIYLRIVNWTQNSYKGKQTLYIGAIKDNQFYITDSISSEDTILKLVDGEVNTVTKIHGIQDWRPNTSKVKKISNSGIFLFVMSNGDKLFLNPFGFPITYLDGRGIDIHIRSNGLTFDDSKQDYEIVK